MKRILLLAGLVLSFAAAPAAAQSTGVRAGVSGDPDQFVFGLHYETSPLADNLTFRPNVEVGIGDDLMLFALNFEFAYSLPLDSAPWRVYVGGGPAVNIYAFDDDHPGRGDDTEVEAGLNVMFGVQHQRGFFSELKLGAIDSPDIKFVVGYAFR
jgi:hypothetical protein